MKYKHNQFNGQQQHSQTDSNQPVNTLENKESPSLPQSSHTQGEKGLKGSVYLSRRVQKRSQLLVRLLGYGLLVFSLIDYIDIFIPSRFTDPAWEFQMIGSLVEHAVVPFMGLTFVFYRHEGYIGKLERNLLRFLSWFSLLLGLLYLLVLPLGVADTWRIYHGIDTQITAQISQQSQQLQQLKSKLNQATTDEQIKQLITSLAPQNRSQEIKEPQASKEQLLAQITQAEQNIKIKPNIAGNNKKKALIKNSLRWHLGALVAGILFIWTWRLTSWTRNV
jgi:hypothetical protein